MMYGPDSYDLPNHGLDINMDMYRELRKNLHQDVRDATYLAKSHYDNHRWDEAKYWYDVAAERLEQLKLL